MKSSFSFIKDSRFPMMIVSVLAGVLFVTMAVNASTTISTDISTGGTLSVTGLSTFLGGATTTSITLLNGEVISNATDGVVQINGVASSTSVTLLNGETITNATDGTIALTATNVTFSGLASSTTFMVGNNQVSTISGLIFGYCTLGAATVTSASTTYANCTGATGVTSSYKVFVQATSSIPVATFVTAASSTATAGTINVRLHAQEGATDITAATVSLNFWAVR